MRNQKRQSTAKYVTKKRRRSHSKKNTAKQHIAKKLTEFDLNRKEKVEEQIMRIRQEFQYFKSLGYNPNSDSARNNPKFLSAAQGDKLLKKLH